ncbi:hypothetical protein [Salinarimonas chemoclinalis]|uniref:hypothetical protein n=1 Tax=Salinarimonas chemoclinalis TaxID=3241599 RepID=UPI003556FCE3
MSAAPALPLVEETAAEAARRREEVRALVRTPHACGAALVARLGVEAAARALGASPSLVARLAEEPPARRRRLAVLLCERLGIDLAGADVLLAQLPARPVAVAEAAFRFAVTLEVAGAPRVLGRDAYDRLNARFGADAVAFAIARRGCLRAAPDAGRGDADAQTLVARAPNLLVATLAAGGHPLAGPVAAILARPRPPGGAFAPGASCDSRRLAVALDALAAARAHDQAARAHDEATSLRTPDAAPLGEDEALAREADPAPREAASG